MKNRGRVALERQSPPFAKVAKDGAPSSTSIGRREGETLEQSPPVRQGKQE